MNAARYLAILLLLFSINAWSKDADRYLSGSWYNANQDGHGLSVEILPDSRAIIYWYVYHPDGTPTFLIAIGAYSGNRIDADAYYNSGMKFGEFDPDDRTQVPWGNLTLTYNSCNSATLQYSSTMDHNGVPYGSGTIPMTRLASIEGLQCESNPPAGLYQGNFYSEVLNQVIPGFAAVAPNGEFAAISFDAMAGVGNWSASGKNFSASGIAVSADPEFAFSSNLTISGQISSEYRIWGNYNVVGGDRGTLDLYAVPELYRRGISAAEMAGNYTAQNLVSGATGSATISPSGGINASDSFGCQYGGQISIPDERFNLFRVTVTVSSCGVSNGSYEGYGSQIDYYDLDDGRAIRLMATDGQYAGIFDLVR